MICWEAQSEGVEPGRARALITPGTTLSDSARRNLRKFPRGLGQFPLSILAAGSSSGERKEWSVDARSWAHPSHTLKGMGKNSTRRALLTGLSVKDHTGRISAFDMPSLQERQLVAAHFDNEINENSLG